MLKIILCATAVMTGFGLFAPVMASADEGVENAVESVVTDETSNVSGEEETAENTPKEEAVESGDEWFDEVLMPMVIEYGASVVAFATAVFILLKDFNKTKSTLGTAVGALLTSNGNNEDTAKAVAELKSVYEKQMTEMKGQVENVTALFVEALKELKEGLADKVDNADGTLQKLLEVEKLAYGDNAALVSNGTAKKIAEVVGYGKTEDVNEK
jgi:hypothetical protein